MKGSIALNGVTLAQDPQSYKSQIAYIPETPILYEELTLKEHLEMTMLAYGLDQEQAWQRAHDLLKTFRLANKLDWFPANFSKGMKQKVMIVCAFITNAKLFIIDEPFLGLDPLAVHDLLALIATVKAQEPLSLCRRTFWTRLKKLVISLYYCMLVKYRHRGLLLKSKRIIRMRVSR